MTWWNADSNQRDEIEHRVLATFRGRVEAALDVATAGAALLEVASALDFVGTALWLSGTDGRLHCAFFGATVDMSLFEEQTRGQSFRQGEGMPGRTWLHLTPEWIPNVIRDDNFPRLRGAIRDLVRCVVAVPMFVDPAVTGIIELYSRVERDRDERTIELLASIALEFSRVSGTLLSAASRSD